MKIKQSVIVQLIKSNENIRSVYVSIVATIPIAENGTLG